MNNKKPQSDDRRGYIKKLMLVLDKLPGTIYRFDTGVLHLSIIPEPNIINEYGETYAYTANYQSMLNSTRLEYNLSLDEIEFSIIEILSDLLDNSYQVLKGIELEKINVAEEQELEQ